MTGRHAHQILNGPSGQRIRRAVMAALAESAVSPEIRAREAVQCGQCGEDLVLGTDRAGFAIESCARCGTTARSPRGVAPPVSTSPTRTTRAREAASDGTLQTGPYLRILQVLPARRADRLSAAEIGARLGRYSDWANQYLGRLLAAGKVCRVRDANPKYPATPGAPPKIWAYWRAAR